MKIYVEMTEEEYMAYLDYLNTPITKKDNEQKPSNNKIYDTSVMDCFSTRPANILRRNGIYTINDLLGKTLNELSRLRNMGKKSLFEIVKFLEEQGLSLADKTTNPLYRDLIQRYIRFYK